MSYLPNLTNLISTNNARAASTLAPAAVYQGTSEDVSAYGRAGISIYSDNATDGVLTIEVSRDGTLWSEIPRTFANTSIAEPHMWAIVEQYFRIKYTNGSTSATNLTIQVQYSVNDDILLGHQLDATLLDETEAIVSRSVGVGQDPNGIYTNEGVSGVDDSNSSSVNLLVSTSLVFTGAWIDISNYIGITVLVEGAASGTVAGTLQMQFSHDGVTAHRNITVNEVSVANVQPRTLGAVAKYFRVIFTAASDLTAFDIQTMLHTQQVSLVSRLDQTLSGTEDVTNVRAALVGKTDGGEYNNVGVSGDGSLQVGLPLTAFGDLRVAELTPVYQVSFEYTVTNTETGAITVANTGTITQADAMCVAGTGTTTGSSAEWEIARHVKYKPGLGGLNRFTAMFTAGVSGTEQSVGITDESGSSETHANGFAIGFSGTTFGFLRWQNDSLIVVAQTAWDDPLDGTGPSGMTLDPTKLNVYFIDFQYLGAGAIHIWVESDSTGKMLLVHTVPYSNLHTVPSIYMPNFHLMIHVGNGGTTSDMVVKSASMAYFVEGKTMHAELQETQETSEKQTISSVTTEAAIFTIRNKATYAGKTNFIDIILEFVSASIEASAPNNLGDIRLIRNTTLGGSPSYSDISTTNSVCEIDTAGTTVSGGKTLIGFDLAGKNDRDSANLTPYGIIITPGETVTVACTSANSATFNASLLWKELF